METGSVERVLRDLPGVLDCSVHDEGIAIVVHPEIDPHMMELRAQVALAEIGERRPLLVVGGMSTGLVEPSPPMPVRRGRRGLGERSPVSLLGFAVLVVALITVVPIAGGNNKAPRLPNVAAPLSGGVPVVDEPVAVVAAATAAAVFGPVAPAARAVAKAVAHRATDRPAPNPAPAAAPAAPAPVSAAVAAPTAGVVVAHAKPGRASAEAKGKAKAVGKGRVRAAHASPSRGRGPRR
ncbi:MAG TPA: hypothetical protein VM938_14290 [Acidimicrobiales bacterium]|nr:hypothetical protein [Acidimicrobiales bacterium]